MDESQHEFAAKAASFTCRHRALALGVVAVCAWTAAAWFLAFSRVWTLTIHTASSIANQPHALHLDVAPIKVFAALYVD